MSGQVYLLHFERPLQHAQHYLGWTSLTLEERMQRHTSLSKVRRGSALLRAVIEAQIPFHIARTWDGDRALERRLKSRHNARKLCPLCSASHPGEEHESH